MRVVTGGGKLSNFPTKRFRVIGWEALNDAAGVGELVGVEAEKGFTRGAEGLVGAVAIAQQ